MKANSIPCEIFTQASLGHFSNLLNPYQIIIIDIHKLTKEKKGEGVSVDVEFFGSKNLIFVDEGHKGVVVMNGKISEKLSHRKDLHLSIVQLLDKQ